MENTRMLRRVTPIKFVDKMRDGPSPTVYAYPSVAMTIPITLPRPTGIGTAGAISLSKESLIQRHAR